jgi:hypothetical protein
MADFTVLTMDANTGTQATPVWTSVLAANREVRWYEFSTAGGSVTAVGWPATIRPTSGTAQVNFTYAYPNADGSGGGLGFLGNTSAVPATYIANTTNYHFARWNWDAVGSFASAPIFTAYNTTAHTGPTVRNSPSGGLLEGSADTTNVSAFSYLKGNAFGQVALAAIGTNLAAPTITAGTVGSLGPTAGANWMAAFQSLMADLDYITAPFTPAPTAANFWSVHFALFMGLNMTPGTLVPVMALKYTFS